MKRKAFQTENVLRTDGWYVLRFVATVPPQERLHGPHDRGASLAVWCTPRSGTFELDMGHFGPAFRQYFAALATADLLDRLHCQCHGLRPRLCQSPFRWIMSSNSRYMASRCSTIAAASSRRICDPRCPSRRLHQRVARQSAARTCPPAVAVSPRQTPGSQLAGPTVITRAAPDGPASPAP